MTLRAMICGAFALLPMAANALSLPSTAALTVEEYEELSSFYLPVGPYENGAVEKLMTEGAVTHRAWRIRSSKATTLQMLDPLREELVKDGYNILYECASEACGGFDFRFETLVLAEPDMHVDLGDFRFVAAGRFVSETPEYISLLVSRSAESGFVQLTTVGAGVQSEVAVSTKTPDIDLLPLDPLTSPMTAPSSAVVDALRHDGSVVLEGLTFETGSAALAPGDYASLSELATFLNENPAVRVTLVGHTDADGSLAGNIALSKRRAGSVAAHLVGAFGVSAAQVQSEGVGFLAPRASNLEAQGRSLNRRVEVVLTVAE